MVDCYQPRQHPYPLSDIGGTITGWTVKQEAPTATVVYVAAGAEARTFLRATSTWEQEWAWGRQVETYTESSGDTEAELVASAKEVLDAAAPQWGVSVELTSGPTFDFGRNVWLGDRVGVEIGGEQGVVTDLLREVVITSDKGLGVDGLPVWSFRPTIGEVTNSSYRLYRKVATLAAKLNRKD